MIKKKTRRNPKLYPEQRIIHRDEEQEFLLQLAKIETQQQKERNLKLYPELVRSKNFFFNLQKLKLNSKKKEI